MIYTVTLNPALDKTVQVECFAAGKVNRILSSRTDPGGKGINVSRTLEVLHQHSVVMGILGGHTGDLISDSLRESGFQCDFTWCQSETRTNLKIVDPILGVTTDINDGGAAVGENALTCARQKLLHQLQPGDTVVLSGSLPAGTPAAIYRDWILECRALGAEVFLDASGEPLALAVGAAPYCVKPNREELQALTGYRLDSVEDAAQAGWQLTNKGISQVVVSLGMDGALLITREKVLLGSVPHIPALSSVGAGDTMVAALIYCRTAELSPEESLRMAIAASGAKVMRSGTEPPAMPDIQALLPQVTVTEL